EIHFGFPDQSPFSRRLRASKQMPGRCRTESGWSGDQKQRRISLVGSDFKISRHYPVDSFQHTFGGDAEWRLILEPSNKEPLIIIGERPGWSNMLSFGISPADHRHHTYIIGKTRSGTTTLLR